MSFERPQRASPGRLARLLFALLLAACNAALAQTPSPHAIDIPRWFATTFLDFREDVDDAARDGKRLLVYFGQDGCPYCTKLMTVNFSQQAIVDKTRRHFVATAINIFGDREVTWTDGRAMTEKELARVLQVQFTPTILIFDEATSALDSKSEKAIQAELARIARGRTALVIAHRLSTVVDADQILVLDHGRIVERGTHQELLASDAIYAGMWALQQREDAAREDELSEQTESV